MTTLKPEVWLVRRVNVDQKLPFFLETKPAFFDFEKQDFFQKTKKQNKKTRFRFQTKPSFFPRKGSSESILTCRFSGLQGAQGLSQAYSLGIRVNVCGDGVRVSCAAC